MNDKVRLPDGLSGLELRIRETLICSSICKLFINIRTKLGNGEIIEGGKAFFSHGITVVATMIWLLLDSGPHRVP